MRMRSLWRAALLDRRDPSSSKCSNEVTQRQPPNLYFLGGKNYKYLPNYTKAFDICMMPFAMNELTKNINPTKLLEYLAAGKPVISTAIPDVIKYYSGLVEIAHTKEEFVELAEKLLREDGRERILRGIERAQQSSWGAMAQFMTRKQLAKRWSVSVRLIDYLIATGQIDIVRIGKKAVRIRPSAAEEYERKQTNVEFRLGEAR